MALVPIAILVPVAVEEAVAVAIGAASLLGEATSHSFTSPPTQPTQPPPQGGPHEAPPPRMVTAGEQALAQSIANRIDACQGDVRNIYEFHHVPSQPDQETPPQDKMTDAGNQFRRITTAMTTIEAGTIAAPGKVHIESVKKFIQVHGGVFNAAAQAALTTLLVDAQRLLASLATPAGIA